MSTVVIGAGAGGLALSIKLKMLCPDEKVTVLEHLDAVGKKILATGNGRCNLSNIKAKDNEKVIAFFESIGLKTRCDDDGRIYPYSMKATTVRDILLDACNKYNVIIKTNENVISAKKHSDIFTIKCESGNTYKCQNLVIATGGKAQPKLGSDGSGYRLLTSFNHSITPLCPALVQLTSSSKYPRKISGQRIKCNMAIELDGNEVAHQYGELLFTDYGLSGIVAMNLSFDVAKNFESEVPKKCVASIDLAPDMTEEEIANHISKFGSAAGIIGYDIDSIISKQAQGDKNRLAAIIKGWRFIITGTKGYTFAQVTMGGAKTDEFNSDFESKKVTGLYACGEVLQNTYECGGFNLNFAFSSGLTVAEKISKQNTEDIK